MAVPKLRFPEYKDGKEWGNTTIGQEGTFYYGKSAPKWSITEDAKTPCIRYGELYTKHNIIVKEISSYTNIDPQNLKFSKGNEVLVPRVGEDPLDFHKCAYLPFKNVAIGEMISVYNTDNNPLFMSYYFNATMKYKFARYVEGGNVSNLYYVYLKNIKIHMPDYMEQRKIADFLATFDKRITTQQNIIADLEETKKGLLQKIFSQEIRFKDDNGQNYPDWESIHILDIAHTYIGLVTTMTENYVEKGTLLIRNSDIKENCFSFGKKIFLDEEFANNNANRKHCEGDVITVHTGDIGTSAVIDKSMEGSIGFATIVTRVKDKSRYNSKYISWYYNSPIYKKYALRMSTGDGRNNLNMKDFNKAYIPVPCFEEQNKIADFLSTFDKKITAEKQILSDLQEMKKGLLQQMFV